MARPKGVTQKRNESKYWLPVGVVIKEGQSDSFNKATKLTFIDEQYGEFVSNFYYLQGANASTHPASVNKRREATNLEVYGHINAGASKSSRKKASDTMEQRYGVRNALQNKDILAKSRATLKASHGVDHPGQTEASLNIVRNHNVMKTEEGKEALRLSMLKNHGVENPMFKQEIREKQKENLRKAFIANNHLNFLPNGKNVSDYCKELSKEDRIGYANIIYRKYGAKATEEWLDHPEGDLTSIEFKFTRMFPNAERINKYIVPDLAYKPDFKIKDIYIDIDGLYFHSEARKDKDYHIKKRENFNNKGLKLLQFREDELNFKSDIIKSIINSKLNIYNTTIFARKTIIKELNSEQMRDFFESNHLMGNHPSSRGLGLFDKESKLIAALSYRKIGTGVDISRFCNKLNYKVIGGLSKLLAYLIKLNKYEFIQSFVDMRYGDGFSLKKLSFDNIGTTLGWKWTDSVVTYNRLHCRANMDDRQLTEKEYAKELKLLKIYDAGQSKFILNLKR